MLIGAIASAMIGYGFSTNNGWLLGFGVFFALLSVAPAKTALDTFFG